MEEQNRKTVETYGKAVREGRLDSISLITINLANASVRSQEWNGANFTIRDDERKVKARIRVSWRE